MHAFRTHSNLNFLPTPLPNFGAWIQKRRLALGYNLKKAGTVAGISRYDWDLLEYGYVPTTENESFLHSLAGTLEIRFDDLVYAVAQFEAQFANTRDDPTSDEHHQAEWPAA